MRVPYETMVKEFTRVLEKYGFTEKRAKDAAEIFAQNSLAGVQSHGLNRFPRVVDYLKKGEIDPKVEATCTASSVRWSAGMDIVASDHSTRSVRWIGLSRLPISMASDSWLSVTITIGCGAARMAGRRQIRAVSVSAGRTPVRTCRPGAQRSRALETIR